MSSIEKVKLFIKGRRMSYLQTFNPNSKTAVDVLEDLAKFCRAHETTYHPDPRMHAVLEGRREVWLRIQQHLQLKDEDLWKLYGGNKL